VAKALKRDLGVEVELVSGRYGEFTVRVDGMTIADAGPLGFLGILPSPRSIEEAVRRISSDKG
jgi:hypothetical protein